jgi:uncharacterized ferredoxin-like protein
MKLIKDIVGDWLENLASNQGKRFFKRTANRLVKVGEGCIGLGTVLNDVCDYDRQQGKETCAKNVQARRAKDPSVRNLKEYAEPYDDPRYKPN